MFSNSLELSLGDNLLTYHPVIFSYHPVAFFDPPTHWDRRLYYSHTGIIYWLIAMAFIVITLR